MVMVGSVIVGNVIVGCPGVPLMIGIGRLTVVGVPWGPGMVIPMPGALVAVGAGVLVGTGVGVPARATGSGGSSIRDIAQ
jgi:hypothetical protein